jgi:hypothetical protein
MLDLSKEYVIKASKRINPSCKIIIKYPQWYDRFHERGYDVIRETEALTKSGSELKRAIMKINGGAELSNMRLFYNEMARRIGGKKCGGGWFDWWGLRKIPI